MKIKTIKTILIIIIIILALFLISTLIIMLFNNAKKNYKIKDVGLELTYKINNDYFVKSIRIDDVNYMFLPKSANLSNLVLSYNLDIKKTSIGKVDKKNKTIKLKAENNLELEIYFSNNIKEVVKILQSDVPAIHINLKDADINTVNKGSKDIKYDASVKVTGCKDKALNIEQKNIVLKGRGNYTWLKEPKKSYQIKLDSKENLLGIGNDKAKKWVLTANYCDPTLLNNKITYDVCLKSGLSNIPNSTHTDLYINGEYLGTYLLSDKVEINDGRIELKNEKGVLAELDMNYYDEETDPKFTTNRGNKYVIKDSVASQKELGDEIAKEALEAFERSINELEEKLYSDDTNWEEIENLIDINSFAKYFLINEFTNNIDTFRSSLFMYKDGDDDLIHIGPTWDYDNGYYVVEKNNKPEINYTLEWADENYIKQLFRYEEFKIAVYECYANEINECLSSINIDNYSKEIKNSSYMNLIRWYGNKPSYYNSCIEQLKIFIEKRLEHFKDQYGYILKYGRID